MGTISHSLRQTNTYRATTKTSTQKKEAGKNKQAFWETMEFNRFGVIAWVLSIVSCFSGIVAGLFVNGNSQLEITLAAAPTVLTLVFILNIAPIRWILGIGIVAVIT